MTPITFTSGLNIDCDGSPRAYAPAGSGLVALDYLANAGSPGNWYGIACDAAGEPYRQANGYYVSTTALQDHSKAVWEPLRYVNSEIIPYIVIPRGFPAKLGDLAQVEYNNKRLTAIIADVGPKGKYGEGSIALAKQLGINADPKHGGIDKNVTYYVYAGSSIGWPKEWIDIEARMSELI